MIEFNQFMAKTLIYVSIAGLVTAHYQFGEDDFERDLDGEYSISQNHHNQSISWYPGAIDFQEFSSAAGSLAIGILDYQDSSSSYTELNISTSQPTG